MTVLTEGPQEKGSPSGIAVSYVHVRAALNIHFLLLPFFLTSSGQTNRKHLSLEPGLSPHKQWDAFLESK